MQSPSVDSLRTVLDSVFAAPKYAWVPRPDATRWLMRQIARLLEWFAQLEAGQPLVYWLIIFALLAVLVAIFVHGGFIMVRAMRYASAQDRQGAVRVAERRDARWYRDRATRLANEGHYPEAIRTFFEGLVLELDASGSLRWHPSKTPREYAREAALGPSERARLGALVDGVYDYSFAGVPCGEPEWVAWRARAGEVSRVH